MLKRLWFYVICAIGLATVFVLTDKKETTLHILHTNDLHAHLIPWAPNDACMDETKCRGGFARIKALIDTYRQTHPNTLVLDAGDRFSGTVFYTFRKSYDLINTLSDMGYDAFTAGNHDFDDGIPELARFITETPVPLVIANIDLPDKTLPIKRHIVLQKNGVPVGIIGAVTEAFKTETKGSDTITVHPVEKAVCAEATVLKKQGVDIIIALTHIGIEADKALANACPDVDIIVGGHSHVLLSNTEPAYAPYPYIITHSDGTQTAIVTAGMGGHHIGALTVHFDKRGKLLFATGDTLPVTKNIAPDLTLQQKIAAAQNALADLLNTPLATVSTPFPLTPDTTYCSENCAVGNVLADLALAADPQADFAILNSGAIRAALPAGTITIEHVAQAYPFDSELVTVPMTGQEIIDFIKQGVSKYKHNNQTNQLAIVAGFSYTFNPKTKTVTQMQTILPDKLYTVVVPSFLANGGDGFPKKEPIRILSSSVRDTLIAELKKQTPYITPNRIVKE